MKKFLLLIFLITLGSSLKAMESDEPVVIIDGEYRFLIKDYKQLRGYDYAFEIVTTDPRERLIIDCQSFIHALHIFEKDADGNERQIDGIALDERECGFIAFHVMDHVAHKQLMCLKINPELFTISVGDDPAFCLR